MSERISPGKIWEWTPTGNRIRTAYGLNAFQTSHDAVNKAGEKHRSGYISACTFHCLSTFQHSLKSIHFFSKKLFKRQNTSRTVFELYGLLTSYSRLSFADTFHTFEFKLRGLAKRLDNRTRSLIRPKSVSHKRYLLFIWVHSQVLKGDCSSEHADGSQSSFSASHKVFTPLNLSTFCSDGTWSWTLPCELY